MRLLTVMRSLGIMQDDVRTPRITVYGHVIGYIIFRQVQLLSGGVRQGFQRYFCKA